MLNYRVAALLKNHTENILRVIFRLTYMDPRMIKLQSSVAGMERLRIDQIILTTLTSFK